MDAILTKWVGLLITGFKLAAGSIVGRVMAALGLTWVNFTYTLPTVKNWITDKFVGLDPHIREFLAATGIDIFMILVVSAIVARVGLRTITTSLTALQGLMGNEGGT